MNIESTPIAGLFTASFPVRCDNRGAFARLFCENELAPIIGARHIVQINRSLTNLVGTVRGLHFQHPPHAEMKLVRCLRGRVWDVAIDVRRDSPTFLQWHGQELSPENGLMLVIPEGFAHGFQVLEADSELLYLHTAAYAPSVEAGLNYHDPALGISWPLAVTEISARDNSMPFIDSSFLGLQV